MQLACNSMYLFTTLVCVAVCCRAMIIVTTSYQLLLATILPTIPSFSTLELCYVLLHCRPYNAKFPFVCPEFVVAVHVQMSILDVGCLIFVLYGP